MKQQRKPKQEAMLQVYDNVLPPNNKQVEDTVLGTIILDGDVIHKIAHELSESLFFFEQNKTLCSVIAQMHKESMPIDLLTVSRKLRESNLSESLPNVYLMQLTERVATSANFEAHFRMLQELSLKRIAIGVCSKGIRESYADNRDAFDLLANLQHELDDALKNVITYQIGSVGEIHSEIVSRSIELFNTKAKSGVPTGLRLVDNVTSGWQETDLIILAGRPSMGKTAAAISMALYPALEENIPIGIFSLEMSKTQLVSRMQSILSGVNVGKIVRKQLEYEEIEAIEIKGRKLKTAPIYIDDTPSISIQEFKGKARKMVRELGCKFIIVDYLQLMRSGEKTHSREHEIAEISRSLKAVAKELNVPVMALSQLSRAVESRGDKKPLLSDLRESGQIEQDADMVCFCYRPEYYEIENYEVGGKLFDTDGLFMLIVAKHRNGGLGEIPLRFLHEQTKLEDYDFMPPAPVMPQLNQARQSNAVDFTTISREDTERLGNQLNNFFEDSESSKDFDYPF